MTSDRAFYTYKQTIGPYEYIGKGCGRRYLSISFRTRGKFYKHAVEKYGLWKAEIIRFYESEEKALRDERRLIAEARANNQKLLNRTDGGDGVSGYKHDICAKQKISATQKNRSDEQKKRIKDKTLATLNAKTPEERAETRRKQSEANKGKQKPQFTEAHRRNLSLSHKGKQPSNKGVSKSKEEFARRTATRQANRLSQIAEARHDA